MTDLARAEQEKYEAVWSHDVYRRVSPAWLERERAWDALGCEVGQSLIDYGCGTGRATNWFAGRGLKASGVDHVGAALEHFNFPFVEACLWNMPDDLGPSDYAFCCDVMEHIPPEKVDLVISSIAARTRIAGYFRIATRPDVMGPKLLGQPLHLTVHSGEWWAEAFRRSWSQVSILSEDGRDVICMCRA